MSEDELIAPCGMNCALCISYQSERYDLHQSGMKRKYCPGCLPRGEHCLHMGKVCTVLGQGELRFCFECHQFPCSRLKSLDRRYRDRYHMSMIDNLKKIRDHGLRSFSTEQQSHWACYHCGELICCHVGLCLHCNLNVLLENKRYRWGEPG